LPRSRSTSREPVVAAVMNKLSATLSTLIPVGLTEGLVDGPTAPLSRSSTPDCRIVRGSPLWQGTSSAERELLAK
jgi:hypothetical protein